MGSKIVEIQITEDEIKALFSSIISSKHVKFIAEVVVGNLSTTEVGLRQLYLAMNGVFTPVNFKVGQSVYVKPDQLYSWYFNQQQMEEEGYLINGLMPCIISEIDNHAKNRVTVKYKYIDKDGKEKETDTAVDETKIIDGTDGFLDVNVKK